MYKTNENLCKTKMEKDMKLAEIKPFVRFSRYMTLNKESRYSDTVACDARFFFVTSGNASILADGKVYKLKKGDALIFKAGTEYKIGEGEPHVTYLVLNFDFTYSNSHIQVPVSPKLASEYTKTDLVEDVSFEGGEFSSPVYLEGMERISARLERINREYSRKYLHKDLKISGILTDILISCIRAKSTSEVLKGERQIESIIDYVREHSDKKITNVTLGKLFGFHPNYLSTIIKRYTGVPLHTYLLRLRLSNALELLTGTSMSVGEIAERVGFCDIFYFSKYFKETFGYSPNEYRRQNAGI